MEDEVFRSSVIIDGSSIAVVTMNEITVDGIRSSKVNDQGYFGTHPSCMIQYREDGSDYCNEVYDPEHNECLGTDAWRWYPHKEIEED